LSRLPIRLRVTLVFVAIMAVVLAATGLFLRLRLETSLDQSIDRDLRSRAAGLVREIRVGDKGLGEAARNALNHQGENFAQVLTGSGRLFHPSGQPSVLPVLDQREVRQARVRTIVVEHPHVPGLGGEPVRLRASPIVFEKTPLIVVVGASLGDRDEALSSLTTLLLIGGPIALLLASLAAYGTVAAALRPVELMRERAAEISTAEAGERLPVAPAHDELHRLGETLNEMLDRLQAALERERAFVDDASHELRTPLALHKTELELALRYGESSEELRASIASAIEEADRLARLAEDLLLMARSDKGRLAIEAKPVEVGVLYANVSGKLGGRALEAGRKLGVDQPNGLMVQADRPRVEQALTNLVDNALRHGEGPIRLWAHSGADGVELHVSDTGPGFPPDLLQHAFDRFTRGDAARAEGGTGLGLAIVEAIASAHGGRAEAANSPNGGADVWIVLRAG
jgi:two-component system, OmpR family, sensor kinase